MHHRAQRRLRRAGASSSRSRCCSASACCWGWLWARVLNDYAQADPAALWQAAGATGAFVAGLGAIGYATRRDLSSWYRVLFWALLALIVFGLVAIFVSIPNANLIWSVAGL